jgi:alpha-L-fucosidase
MVEALLVAACLAQAPAFTEEPSARDERMTWWREARFGLFIHWGLYAIPAGQWNGRRIPGTGEWIMHNGRIEADEYDDLVARFNPVLYDPDAWVRAAKRAGMRYIIITSKHHDGFALWDSAASDYDVTATPFGRDILRELVDSCRRHAMRVGFYYSIMDWHHPDYLPRRAWEKRGSEGADFGRYEAYLRSQVRELLTNYGPVDVLWFDGEWEDTWTHEKGVALDAFVRSLQPRIIVNNRVDKGRNDMAGLNREGTWAGDFGTPEQEVPRRAMPDVDWESCVTMNDSWGYRTDDLNYKSSTELIRLLCDVVGKGGNLLLNIGPTADGIFPQPALERLGEIARWMDVHAEAIHGTTGGPFARTPWGACTARGDALYVIVYYWPSDGVLRLPGLRTQVRTATLLGSPAKVAVWDDGEGVSLRLPDSPANPHASVLRLDLNGPARVEPVPNRPDAEGRYVLRAPEADIEGQYLRLTHREDAVLTHWTSREDFASWTVSAPAGLYLVEIDLACAPDYAGSEFVVEAGGTHYTGRVPSTGSWDAYTLVRLGSVPIEEAPARVVVRPGEEFTGALMNLRTVYLTPVDEHGRPLTPRP